MTLPARLASVAGWIAACAVVGIVLFFAAPVVNWFAERLYRVYALMPILTLFVIFLAVVVFVPMSAIRRTRRNGAACLLASSYVFGLNCWLLCFIMSWLTLGALWLTVGIALAGVGVPIAIIGCVSHGAWPQLGSILLNLSLTFGARIAGIKLRVPIGSPA